VQRAREARAAGREQFPYAAVSGLRWTGEGTTQLVRAAALNNLPRVLQLIQLGAPLDLVDEMWGRSALHWACGQGHEHIAKALLDGKYEGRGATADLLCKADYSTALIDASTNGHESIVRLLLSRGAKQELQDRFGYTALHSAVEGDHPGVVALLCAGPGAAAALALKTNVGYDKLTPLSHAVFFGRSACEAVLRVHGAPAFEDVCVDRDWAPCCVT
jgi:ankyrin repeat protein